MPGRGLAQFSQGAYFHTVLFQLSLVANLTSGGRIQIEVVGLADFDGHVGPRLVTGGGMFVLGLTYDTKGAFPEAIGLRMRDAGRVRVQSCRSGM